MKSDRDPAGMRRHLELRPSSNDAKGYAKRVLRLFQRSDYNFRTNGDRSRWLGFESLRQYVDSCESGTYNTSDNDLPRILNYSELISNVLEEELIDNLQLLSYLTP